MRKRVSEAKPRNVNDITQNVLLRQNEKEPHSKEKIFGGKKREALCKARLRIGGSKTGITTGETC